MYTLKSAHQYSSLSITWCILPVLHWPLRILQGSSDLSKHRWLQSESLCAEPIIADGPRNHFFSFQRWASLEVFSSPRNSVFFVLCILTYSSKENIVSGQKAHTSRVKGEARGEKVLAVCVMKWVTMDYKYTLFLHLNSVKKSGCQLAINKHTIFFR